MRRPIWSGSISFGLVNVPVKLFSATSPKEVHFHMLHDKDLARIQQKRVCSKDFAEVAWEHIIKGFEISRGRYVSVTKDELAAFTPSASKSIEIEDFVELAQIDPIYYETTYYLVPDKNAAKAYSLLLEAMKRTGKVGVARFVLRTRQYLCAVRPVGHALALSTMLYGDEVVAQKEIDGLPAAQAKPGDRELKMAEQLIESLTGKFDIGHYKDDYREKVLALLKQKAAGGEIKGEAEEVEPRGKVVSLMDALQKSLAAAKQQAGDKAGGGKAERGEVRKQPATQQRAAARAPRARKPPARSKRKSG